MTLILRSLVLLFLPAMAYAQDWASVSALFEDRCVFCHSGDFAPLGLQLDSYSALMQGSENGVVVQPGLTAQSPLYDRITGKAEPRMPLDGPPFLNAVEIALIGDWIAAGAAGPATETPRDNAPLPDPRADGQILYSEVARIFGQACIRCHSDNGIYETPPEGLRLDSYDAILAGGDRIVVIPGFPQTSEIVRRIAGTASPRMPFDGPPWLSDDDIALLSDWIAGGALSSDAVAAPLPVGGQVRLRGVMTAVDEIDGVPFRVTEQTRIDDRPVQGDLFEVRARIAADGHLIAERLRAR